MTLWSPCALKHVMWQRVFQGASEYKVRNLIWNGSFLQFMCVGSLAGVTYLRYTVLTSPNKGETAVHCCDPPLSVLVMLVSRNVFHVVSALQSIVFNCSHVGIKKVILKYLPNLSSIVSYKSTNTLAHHLCK